MINKLTLSGLVLLSAIMATPQAIAQESSDMSANYDVRRTEAFNLVSSAYRGDFEDQGISGYNVLMIEYEAGNLTAEDIIKAAIEAGDLSPAAMEDDGYVNSVDAQLSTLSSD